MAANAIAVEINSQPPTTRFLIESNLRRVAACEIVSAMIHGAELFATSDCTRAPIHRGVNRANRLPGFISASQVVVAVHLCAFYTTGNE